MVTPQWRDARVTRVSYDFLYAETINPAGVRPREGGLRSAWLAGVRLSVVRQSRPETVRRFP